MKIYPFLFHFRLFFAPILRFIPNRIHFNTRHLLHIMCLSCFVMSHNSSPSPSQFNESRVEWYRKKHFAQLLQATIPYNLPLASDFWHTGQLIVVAAGRPDWILFGGGVVAHRGLNYLYRHCFFKYFYCYGCYQRETNQHIAQISC